MNRFKRCHDRSPKSRVPNTILPNIDRVALLLGFCLFFIHYILIQSLYRYRFSYSCGLYYKSFTIIIYDHNESSQYYKTMIMIVSYAPNLALALASIVNYDRKCCHNLKRHLLTIIVCLWYRPLMSTKNDVILGQASWSKMMSPGGKLTAPACHPSKK